MVELTVRDDTGRLAVVFFNQPWRAKQLEAGTEAIFFGKVGEYRGARQMVNPVVDVVAGVTPGRRDAAHPARVPRVGQGRADQSGRSATFVEEALGRAGEFADPLPRGVAVVARPVGAGPRRSAPSTSPSRSTWSGRPGGGWSSTSSSGCSWRSSCAGAPSR